MNRGQSKYDSFSRFHSPREKQISGFGTRFYMIHTRDPNSRTETKETLDSLFAKYDFYTDNEPANISQQSICQFFEIRVCLAFDYSRLAYYSRSYRTRMIVKNNEKLRETSLSRLKEKKYCYKKHFITF